MEKQLRLNILALVIDSSKKEITKNRLKERKENEVNKTQKTMIEKVQRRLT